MSNKLDPKQVFVCMSTSREDIADELNDLIASEGWDIKKFEPNDERLTDKFCQDFADCTGDAFTDCDDTYDREYTRQRAFAAATFQLEFEEEDE